MYPSYCRTVNRDQQTDQSLYSHITKKKGLLKLLSLTSVTLFFFQFSMSVGVFLDHVKYDQPGCLSSHLSRLETIKMGNLPVSPFEPWQIS